MKRLWKFELTLEDEQTLYVGADGNPDSASMFAAEEDAAKQEAVRRVFEFEKVYGVTPASVRYESHGKANAEMSGGRQPVRLHRLVGRGREGKKSMSKQWCRFCDKWHAPFNGHICDPEDLRRHVVALGNRADEAESVIDWLRTQAVSDIAPGFVGIPQVEWDAVFAANARPHAEAVADVVHDQQMHRVAEMADAPRPQAPASGQPEHGGDCAGSSPAPAHDNIPRPAVPGNNKKGIT